MESIAELEINLPRIVPVETPEGLTIVQIDAAVRDIKGV
jgi:hypothetical protein